MRCRILSAASGSAARSALLEHLLDRARQSQQRPAGARRTGVARALEHAHELVVVEAGDHRRAHHADRHARLRERLDHLEPALAATRAHGSIVRASSASIHARLTLDVHAGFARELGDQIDVALDQRVLRDHRDRVAILEADLETLPRQLELLLDRLVAVGDAGEHHELALPARLVERLAQQLRRLRLDDDLRVEVGARTEVEILVRRPGIAVMHDVRHPRYGFALQRKPRSGESLCERIERE